MVAEAALANFFPYLFDGVEFRGGGRQEDEFYVFRDFQCFCPVPRCLVAHQYDSVFGELLGQSFEKYVHAVCIAVWQNKKERVSVQWFNRTVCVTVFPYMMAWRYRTVPRIAPAIFWLVDSPKTRLIVKHQSDATVQTFVLFLLHGNVNFFVASIASSLALFGC